MTLPFNWRTMMLCLVIIGVIALGRVANYYRDHYQAQQKENAALVDALKDRDETITALKGAADAVNRATEEQLKIEQQKRTKTDAENRKLRQALEHSDAGSQPLPDDVKRILRRETQAPVSP